MTARIPHLTLALALGLTAVACEPEPAPVVATPPKGAPVAAQAASQAAPALTAAQIAGENPHAKGLPSDAVHGGMAAGMPPGHGAGGPAGGGGGGLSGKVLERMNAATYTYLKLATSSGEIWAAVPETTTAVGADVTINDPMPMEGFESKTLGRKFDRIVFGTLGAAGGGAPAGAGAMPGGAPHGSAGSQPTAGDPHAGLQLPPAAGVGDVKVDKATAPDARTVAEVFAQKAGLKDKTVTVRGKVVKFSAGVMGKNWVHVRDGSGTDAAKDNDLTFTTQDTVATGDVVTASGTVRTDKDFGAGYFYPVIVEEAKVAK
jgi:hypothetical protein